MKFRLKPIDYFIERSSSKHCSRLNVNGFSSHINGQTIKTSRNSLFVFLRGDCDIKLLIDMQREEDIPIIKMGLIDVGYCSRPVTYLDLYDNM